MNWTEFQAEKKIYEAIWKKMQSEAMGEMAEFLEKSYITVSCGRQFEMDDSLITVAQSCPAFFVDQEAIKKLLKIDQDIQRLSQVVRRMARTDKERLDQHRAEEQIKLLKKQWDKYSPNQLEIIDNWRIEARFPYVDIDLIQELKQSPYCDRELTMMRPASINVILKKALHRTILFKERR